MIPQVVAKAVERGDIPTRKDMEFAIRKFKESNLEIETESIPLPQKKYKTIVVDPPWPVEKSDGKKDLARMFGLMEKCR